MHKKWQLSYGYPMVILWVSYGMIPISALLKGDKRAGKWCEWRGRKVAKGNEGRGRKVAKECGWRGRKVAKGMGWRERKEIFCKKRQMYLHI